MGGKQSTCSDLNRWLYQEVFNGYEIKLINQEILSRNTKIIINRKSKDADGWLWLCGMDLGMAVTVALNGMSPVLFVAMFIS